MGSQVEFFNDILAKIGYLYRIMRPEQNRSEGRVEVSLFFFVISCQLREVLPKKQNRVGIARPTVKLGSRRTCKLTGEKSGKK